MEQDIEKIKEIVDELGKRYHGRSGNVEFAGVEGGTVMVAPSGFCWR